MVFLVSLSCFAHKLLRQPANRTGVGNVVGENVLVHDQVGDEHPWHADTEEPEVELSMPASVMAQHHDEWHYS